MILTAGAANHSRSSDNKKAWEVYKVRQWNAKKVTFQKTLTTQSAGDNPDAMPTATDLERISHNSTNPSFCTAYNRLVLTVEVVQDDVKLLVHAVEPEDEGFLFLLVQVEDPKLALPRFIPNLLEQITLHATMRQMTRKMNQHVVERRVRMKIKVVRAAILDEFWAGFEPADHGVMTAFLNFLEQILK